jgi:hypothetical protein
MVKLQSDSRKNKSSRIDGQLVEANENGEVEVSQEMANLLLSKYSFMGWTTTDGNDIKKVEVSEPIIVEKGEPIQEPIIEDPKTPAEIIEEEESNDEVEVTVSDPIIDEGGDVVIDEIITEESKNDPSIEDIINQTESFNELKEIAKGLDLPEDEWSGYKRADYFKNYLLKKLSE